MPNHPVDRSFVDASSQWLRTYYFMRAAVSLGWITLAATLGKDAPALAAILLVAYPAWDAFANYLDAQKNGGLRSNLSQALNLVVSVITALAVAAALGVGKSAVITVFGAWASLSGLLQLVTALRRWKSYGAQWPMVLSGAQSALAGLFFLKMAGAATPPAILVVAPYAAFGAFYFLLSAIWLTIRNIGKRSEPIANSVSAPRPEADV
jgi:uncharacterized membrane protein HdeD (DUF308 family)